MLPKEKQLNVDETGHPENGSRSEAGRRWLERIWTTIATCTQHGKSVFDFIDTTVRAFFRGTPCPSLLFDDTA